MTLETIYYILAIGFMSLAIVILIAIGLLLFYIKGKVTDLYDMIAEKVDAMSELAEKPLDVAAGLGAIAAKSAKKILQQKK